MMREPDILLAEQHPPLSITACLNLLQNSRNTTSSPAARFLNMSQILAKLISRGKITKLKFKLFRPSLVQPARSLQSGGNQIGRTKGGGKGGRGAHTPGGKGIWFPQWTEDDWGPWTATPSGAQIGPRLALTSARLSQSA